MAAWLRDPIRVLTLVGLLVAGSTSLSAGARDEGQELDRYLRGINLEPAAFASAAGGAVVVKLLQTRKDTDVAVFGMARLQASPHAALRYFLDFEGSLAAGGRRFALLGDPPQPADVAAVSFDDSEFRELRDCVPGDCLFKLPAIGMQLFTRQVDWSSPDAKAQADRLLRDGVLRVLREYRQRGDAAILTYDDRDGVRPHDVFVELAEQMSGWVEYPPELERHLTGYPGARAAGARDVLYWAEDRAPRLRPTLTVSHVVQYASARSPGAVFLARKQLYASHYFDGAFELLAIVDRGDEGTWLLTVRSFRFDQLSGGVLNLRGRVQKRLQDAIRSDLEAQRSVIELMKG